jgi:hypothetical protein
MGDSGPHVSEGQLVALRRDGFLLVEGLSTDEEIAPLRAIFDRMFSERRGWDAGDLFDMIGPDSPEQELALPQLLRPSQYEPLLRQTKLASSARSIAKQILGPTLENDLEHAISKPPFNGAATPWTRTMHIIARAQGSWNQSPSGCLCKTSRSKAAVCDTFAAATSGRYIRTEVRTTIRESTDWRPFRRPI